MGDYTSDMILVPEDANATVSSVLAGLADSADVNASFTLSSGYLVFFMQCGFAMLCSGSVRAKNAKNILLLNILDSCFGVVAWYTTGYAFAFGDPVDENGLSTGNGFIGTQHFFMTTLPTSQYWFWFFQFTFAATGATIVSGAIAERAKFEFYAFYVNLIVMWVYPVITHWQWSASGWNSPTRLPSIGPLLYNSGTIDFAGDGPVHMIGGVAAFWACWILGPRIGRFDSDGKVNDMPGHNASLTLLGVFVLWFGWFGFNPGSVNVITGGAIGEVGAVAVNTTLAAAAGALGTFLTCFLHNYFAYGVVVWDLIMCGNGALAGLVAITSGCATLFPWGALLAGFTGGAVYYGASKFILHVLKFDDPLDAIAVHFACGVWGLLCTGALSAASRVTIAYGPHPDSTPDNFVQRDYGIFMGGKGHLFVCEIVEILSIFGWVTAFCLPSFWLINHLGYMRVSPEEEAAGLDLSFHGGHAYPGEETNEKSSDASVLNSALFEKKLQAAVDKALANGKPSDGKMV